jgi:hypothetical protein
MKISEIERNALTAKYGIDRPPQLDNGIVESIQDVERTIARATRKAGDNSWLFDPIWNPTMHDLADRVMGDVRSRFGSRIAKAPDGAAFLYYPGEPGKIRVYPRDIERFSYLLSYRWHDGCDIGLAPGGCSEGTVFVPYNEDSSSSSLRSAGHVTSGPARLLKTTTLSPRWRRGGGSAYRSSRARRPGRSPGRRRDAERVEGERMGRP